MLSVHGAQMYDSYSVMDSIKSVQTKYKLVIMAMAIGADKLLGVQ